MKIKLSLIPWRSFYIFVTFAVESMFCSLGSGRWDEKAAYFILAAERSFNRVNKLTFFHQRSRLGVPGDRERWGSPDQSGQHSSKITRDRFCWSLPLFLHWATCTSQWRKSWRQSMQNMWGTWICQLVRLMETTVKNHCKWGKVCHNNTCDSFINKGGG